MAAVLSKVDQTHINFRPWACHCDIVCHSPGRIRRSSSCSCDKAGHQPSTNGMPSWSKGNISSRLLWHLTYLQLIFFLPYSWPPSNLQLTFFRPKDDLLLNCNLLSSLQWIYSLLALGLQLTSETTVDFLLNYSWPPSNLLLTSF